MKDFIPTHFEFVIGNSVHEADIVDTNLAERVGSTRKSVLTFKHRKAGTDESWIPLRVLVDELCLGIEGFDAAEIPLYAVRLLRRKSVEAGDLLLTPENKRSWLPNSSAAVPTASKVVANHVYTLEVEPGSKERRIDYLAFSTGFSEAYLHDVFEYLKRMGILYKHPMNREPRTYKFLKNGLKELENFRKRGPLTGADFDFDAKGHKYFHNYTDLPNGASEPFVFVLMPFKESELPQDFYTLRLKPLVEDRFGRSCFPVSEERRTRTIMDKVATYIRDAELVIAEISTRNPNVMYELGLAHAMDKETVVLWNEQLANKKRPFDVNHYTLTNYTDVDFDNVVEAIEAVLK